MMILLRTLRRWYVRSRVRGGHRPSLEALEVRALPTVMHPLSLAARPLDGPGAGAGFTPQQIRYAYGINQIQFTGTTVTADGAGETIAIATAYGDPNLAADVATFSTRFDLPAAQLTIVAQDGSNNLPQSDAAWAQETALDVEWAHAIAPAATLLVVQANSGNEPDLYAAVDYAAAQPGVHVVSMSFGGPEDASETNADAHFRTPANHDGVTFVAAAGDTGTVTYPAASPYVVGVGGTTLTLGADGRRASETAWANGGGGPSQYEPRPAFQDGGMPAGLNNRGTPDVAYDADPATGFVVYDSFGNPDQPWLSVGGTSAGAPQWAALLALANQGRRLNGQGSLDGATQTLPMLYQMSAGLYDVTQGGNGHVQAGPAYDLATGLGTPLGPALVAGLIGPVSPPPTAPPPTTTPPPTTPGDPPPTTTPPTTTPPSFTALPEDASGIAGRPLDGALATITVPDATAADLSATIDWGDGHTSSGMVVSLGNYQYAIEGLINYASVGSDTVTLTITDTAGGTNQSVTLQTVVEVQPAAPVPSAPADPASATPVVLSAPTAPASADPAPALPPVLVDAFLPQVRRARKVATHHPAPRHHPAAHPKPAPKHHRPTHH
jgi:hypothetical protein